MQPAENPDNSIQSVKRAVGTALAQTYAASTYTPNGLPATLTDARGNLTDARGNLTTYQYDGLDRKVMTRYPDKVTAGLYSTTDYEQYGFDNNGNLTSLRKRNGQSITFAYDNLNRLLSRVYPNAADNVGFTYDLLGRRTAVTQSDSNSAIAYAWDNAGRLTGTTAGGRTIAYQYDPAGNRIRTTWPEATSFYVTTTFDALNRPTAIKELGATNLATYAYDDRSRRTTVTLGNATTTTYAYSTTQGTLASQTHNLTGIDEPLVWYEGAGTTSKTWLYADHQGSIVCQADSAGTSTAIYSYGPYGEPNQVAGTRFRYTGQQYLGALGLYYYKARFYSPQLGRFLQTDPIASDKGLGSN